MLVKDVMSRHPICVDINTTIKEAIITMGKEDIGFLPIVKKDYLVGVITDRDILLRSLNLKKKDKISKIMTRDIYSVEEKAPLEDAAKIMSDYKIRRLVVTNDGILKGVITSKDLLKEESLLPYIKNTYTYSYY